MSASSAQSLAESGSNSETGTSPLVFALVIGGVLIGLLIWKWR
jgi:hypothetical protein